MSEATISVNSAESGNKGLKGGALGPVSSVVIGMPTVISPDLSNLPPGERAVHAREIVGLPAREEDDRDDPTPS